LPAERRRRRDRPGGLERVMKLRAFDAFAGLPPAQLAVLAELAEERFFRAGAILQEEGTPAQLIHYLIEGEVEIRRRGKPVRRLGPLSVINGLASLARVQRGHEVAVLADATTLSFTHEDQVDVFEDNFEILAGVLRGTAGALIDARALAGPGSASREPAPSPPATDRALGLVDKITALCLAAPYEDAPLEALAELARESPEVRHAAGERLWRAGEEAGWSLVVVAGCAAAVNGDGAAARFGAGDVAGALESMAGRPRRFDAVAETDLIALRIDSGTLLDTLEQHTDMALGLLHSLARDVLALRERIAAGRSAELEPA
jgi:CRP-like cAMP-binding protein